MTDNDIELRVRDEMWRLDRDVTVAVASLHTIASAHTVASSYKEAANDAIDALQRLTSDRNEWRMQHENLLSVRRTDLEFLHKRLDQLVIERDQLAEVERSLNAQMARLNANLLAANRARMDAERELEAALAEREQVRNDAVRSMRECEVRMRAAEQERDAAIKRAEAAKRDAERYQANGAAIIKRMCDACLLKLDAIAKEGER